MSDAKPDVIASGFGTQWLERACADCNGYWPVSNMRTKPDGRVICFPCEDKIQAKLRDKAQSSLFVQQTSLF